MRDVVSSLLEVPKDFVSIKATTMEKRGIIGKGEGCLAETIILLDGGN